MTRNGRGSLIDIRSIDASNVNRQISLTQFDGLSDVSNILTGELGASHVYSPQKGANEQQVKMLDEGLINLANIMRKDLDVSVFNLVGGGAAGGLGAGLYSFLGAKLQKGIDLVIELIELEEKLQFADLVITGEGQIDYQTKFDKAPVGVARLAKKHDIPCIAVCGSIGEQIEDLYDEGFSSVFSICSGPITLNNAMVQSYDLLSAAVEQTLRTILKSGLRKR